MQICTHVPLLSEYPDSHAVQVLAWEHAVQWAGQATQVPLHLFGPHVLPVQFGVHPQMPAVPPPPQSEASSRQMPGLQEPGGQHVFVPEWT